MEGMMLAMIYDEKNIKMLGDRIREIRTRQKMTQARVASDSGEHQSIISSIERGDRRPSIEFLIWFSNRFNVTLDYLVFGTGEPNGTAPCHCPGAKLLPLVKGSPDSRGLVTDLDTLGAVCIPDTYSTDTMLVAVFSDSSNEPTIKHDALLGLDPADRQLAAGKFFVFKLSSGYHCGRVYFTDESVVIKKEDRTHPEIKIPLDRVNENTLVGRLKWVLQDL